MRLGAWLVVVLAGCNAAPPASRDVSQSVADVEVQRRAPSALATMPTLLQAAHGRALVEQFECARCHDGLPPDVPTVAISKHCVQCHRAIIAGTFDASPATLTTWRGNLTSLRAVPSLAGAGAMLRPAWIAAFLQNPHDVRPHLPATMPRLAVSELQAEAIAHYLATAATGAAVASAAAQASQAAAPADVAAATPTSLGYLGDFARGVALYETYQCQGCHQFSGAALDRPVATAVIASNAGMLAPDLAQTRHRMTPAAVIAWLQDPNAIRPGTAMPSYGFAAADARALATMLRDAPLTPSPPGVIPARLPLLTRAVTYEEVSAAVFRKTCWHCHAQPDYALGDGGPGNTGGFGFAPRRLDVSSASGLAAGVLGADGRRHSIFAPTETGTPLLVEVLLLRQREEAGDHDPRQRLRGMPQGLPALLPTQIQLVETWIAQGRPQ